MNYPSRSGCVEAEYSGFLVAGWVMYTGKGNQYRCVSDIPIYEFRVPCFLP